MKQILWVVVWILLWSIAMVMAYTSPNDKDLFASYMHVFIGFALFVGGMFTGVYTIQLMLIGRNRDLELDHEH